LWVAAEISALATDLAEFLGAALGFYLLFGIPLFPAGLLTGVVVFGILAFEKLGFRRLEHAIMFFVAVIGACYAVEIWWARPAWGPVLEGVLLPRPQSESIYIAVGMLGATVMPHVVYLHSALVLHRNEDSPASRLRHQKMQIFDVLLAMNGAWLVNSAMVVMAAAVFFGSGAQVVSIEQAHETLKPLLGPASATLFAIALLCSGISSSVVGTMAGQVIIEGFLNIRFSIFLRRLITMVTALAVIGMGVDPLRVLILSQVCLSFTLPFALIPLIILTRRRALMGELVNARWINVCAYGATAIILSMNALLLYQTFGGKF
jgi:manganese transport protein